MRRGRVVTDVSRVVPSRADSKGAPDGACRPDRWSLGEIERYNGAVSAGECWGDDVEVGVDSAQCGGHDLGSLWGESVGCGDGGGVRRGRPGRSSRPPTSGRCRTACRFRHPILRRMGLLRGRFAVRRIPLRAVGPVPREGANSDSNGRATSSVVRPPPPMLVGR
jgi:hypothetical protein